MIWTSPQIEFNLLMLGVIKHRFITPNMSTLNVLQNNLCNVQKIFLYIYNLKNYLFSLCLHRAYCFQYFNLKVSNRIVFFFWDQKGTDVLINSLINHCHFPVEANVIHIVPSQQNLAKNKFFFLLTNFSFVWTLYIRLYIQYMW